MERVTILKYRVNNKHLYHGKARITSDNQTTEDADDEAVDNDDEPTT